MVSLSDKTKDTAGDLLSILNSKTTNDMVGPNSSTYDLLLSIFKIMVKKEEFKLKNDEMDDDKNDLKHLNREKRHSEILEALGSKPGEKKLRKKNEEVNLKKIDLKKYLKKQKLKEPKIPKKMEKEPSKEGFGLGDIASIGATAAGVGIIGAGIVGGKEAAAAINNLPKITEWPTSKPSKPPTGLTPETERGKQVLEGAGYRFTSGREGKHVEGSAHYDGRAIDVAVPKGQEPRNKEEAKAQMAKMMELLKDRGIPVKRIIDEYNGRSPHWTGPHYHIEFEKGVTVARGDVSSVLDDKKTDFHKLIEDNSVDNLSMNLQNTSRENIITNEILTGAPQQSNIVNNFTVGSSQQSQQRNYTADDDRSIYERKIAR